MSTPFEKMQPWDWLRRWEAALCPPPNDWGKGWLAFALHRDGSPLQPPMDDIAWQMADEAVDDEAQDHRLPGLHPYDRLHPEHLRIDEETARTLLRRALRHVRPRPVPLRPERCCSWRTVQEVAQRRGVDLRLDEVKPRNERPEHRFFVCRAAGILQQFGLIFVGDVGLQGVIGLVDLVVLQDDRGILLVEAMYGHGATPKEERSHWNCKRGLARAAIDHGLGFLFVGEPPPWEEVRAGTERRLSIPGGRHTVYDRLGQDPKSEPPQPLINYRHDPEELDDNDKLEIAGCLAPSSR